MPVRQTNIPRELPDSRAKCAFRVTGQKRGFCLRHFGEGFEPQPADAASDGKAGT